MEETSRLAKVVLGMVDTDDYGEVNLPGLDELAKAFHTDEATADIILDDVIDELERLGIWRVGGFAVYDVEAEAERKAYEEEMADEHQQYLDDIAASWNAAKGIH